MKMKIGLFIVILFVTFANIKAADPSNPLEPAENKPPKEAGFLLGLGLNQQLGSTWSVCPECIFEDGNKFGYSIGLVYEDYLLNNVLKWGAIALYDNLSIYSSFQEREAFEFRQGEFIPVNFRHHSDISISEISVIPFVKYSPVDFYFVRIGPKLSTIFSSNLEHRKEILDKTANLPTGEKVSVHYPGSKSTDTTIFNGKYPDINSFQFDLSLMTGFNFEFGYNFVLSPYFMINIPLTKTSDFGDEFKILDWRIVAEFRMKF